MHLFFVVVNEYILYMEHGTLLKFKYLDKNNKQ